MAMRLKEALESHSRDHLRSMLTVSRRHESAPAPSEMRPESVLDRLVSEGARIRFAMVDDVLENKGAIRFQKMRVRYLEAGKEGMPVLLGIHGSGTSNAVRSWHKHVIALGEHFHVILPDIPGFGETDKNFGRSTVEYYSGDFLPKFADAIGLERFNLMGTSMGGAIATKFTLDNPNRISHLVNISAYGFNRGDVDLIRYFGTRLSRPIESLQSMANTQFFSNHPEMTYPIVRFVMKHISKEMRDKIRSGEDLGLTNMREYLQEKLPLAELQLLKSEITITGRNRTNLLDRVRRLGDNGVPVLFIVGTRDELVKPDGARRARALLSNGIAFLYEIEGMGHAPQIHRSEEVNRLITDFLNDDYALLRD